MAASGIGFITTRRSLLTRLKQWDDAESWKEFFNCYGPMLHSIARRTGFNETDARDIVQETIVAVAQQMPHFRYDPVRGSFKAWLLTIIRRRMIDRCRKQRRVVPLALPSTRTGSGTAPIERFADPNGSDFERIWENEWQENAMQQALKRVRQKIAPKQFQIYDCYALKGWPVADVVKNLKVSEQQVYTAKHRVAALIKETILQLETRML